MSAIPVLYNNCYGGFCFSDEFEAEYTRRTGRPINTEKRLFRLCGPESIRCDPVAVTIFREMGSEWSSGRNAAIELTEVHPIFEHYWTIEESEGDEFVRVCVSDALADILDDFMETGDLERLRERHAAIKGAWLPGRVPTVGAETDLKTTIPTAAVSVPSPDVGSDGAYSYFGLG